MPAGLLALVLLIAPALSAYAAPAGNGITLVFRYDDYSSRSSTYLDRKVIDLFQKNHLALTIGVVPYVTAGPVIDPGPQEVVALVHPKVKILREAIRSGTVDVALHGYAHHNINRSRLSKPSEFARLDYDSQFLKIKAGQDFLEKTFEVPVDTFIPPYGTYDANTLLALEKLNFRCISSNLSGYASPATPLKFLPNTCELSQLRDVLRYAQRLADVKPIVCVVFHEYDFSEIGYPVSNPQGQLNFRDFEDLVQWVVLQKDIQIKTIDQVVKENVDLSVTRFLNNKYYLRLAHLKPAFWPPFYGYYLPADQAYNLRIRNVFKNYNVNRTRNILAVAAFYGMMAIGWALIAWLTGVIVFRRLSPPPFLSYSGRYGGALLVLFLILYGIFSSSICYTVLIPLVSLAGILTGLAVACPKRGDGQPATGHASGRPDNG
jgi:peptidoglycan/xylan/chitin deacetylase (PgdA/CDA1 family)